MAQDINWGNVETLIINQVTDAINESINMAKIEIDKNTPVDTGELIASNKVNPAKQDGDIIRGSVSNETEYGVYVEYGVLGRKYNYHKWGSVFYTGIGARMYTKAIDKLRKPIAKLIKAAFKFK